ncbi:hypothetical protein MKEN_00070500 [Mycena kentingensis (nom. inval.)]|nr:hypothetical protein MKEN_00070500 [Mycena kentingensis (nom. inval.)]
MLPKLLFVLCLAAAIAAEPLLLARDVHAHSHGHSVPLLELNETEVTLWHKPIGPSYYTIDWDSPVDPDRVPGWLITHAVFMGLAFFVCLPAGIALRSVKHPLHSLFVVAFYASFFVACAASSVYRKMTPNMYPGQVHAKQGYMLLFGALALSIIDALSALRRVLDLCRTAKHLTVRGVFNALLGRNSNVGDYAELAAEELRPIKTHHDDELQHDEWPSQFRRNSDSTHSDGASTVFGAHSPRSEHMLEWRQPTSWITRLGRVVFEGAERILVIGGLAQLLTGIVIYTGGCRDAYINGCLAHLIKGAIFYVYGLVSFARFLGWCSQLGWAWNRPPTTGYPTAELVESALIFAYGSTNAFMERFGASPGDPFTTKQIQHIGIAVMFWFAGLIGIAVESKTIRQWLAALAVKSSENVETPSTYSSSLNPFPALVIGVTGAVMAAHSQVYLFQVQVHMLWGNLLLAGAVMRCMTYFFVWVSPPRSTLPSRPPTEALASFFMAAGGLSFMFSTEELTIAAMRRGRDDIMLFMVAAVAITCLSFAWVILVTAFSGWLKIRTQRAGYRDSA